MSKRVNAVHNWWFRSGPRRAKGIVSFAVCLSLCFVCTSLNARQWWLSVHFSILFIYFFFYSIFLFLVSPVFLSVCLSGYLILSVCVFYSCVFPWSVFPPVCVKSVYLMVCLSMSFVCVCPCVQLSVSLWSCAYICLSVYLCACLCFRWDSCMYVWRSLAVCLALPSSSTYSFSYTRVVTPS